MEKLHVGALPPRSPPPPALPPSPPLLHIMPLLLYFKKTLFPLFPKRSCCSRSRLILSIGPADREFIHRSKFIFNWLGWQRALHVLLDHLLLLLLYLRLCVLYNIVDLAWNTASEERESEGRTESRTRVFHHIQVKRTPISTPSIHFLSFFQMGRACGQ